MASLRRVRRARTFDGKRYISQEDGVLIPPTASSATATVAHFYDDEVLSGDGTENQRPSALPLDWSHNQWLNTPNKWVSEREHAIRKAVSSGALPPPDPFHQMTPAAVPLGSTDGPVTSTSSAAAPYNTFAPQGSNSKEFLDQQRRGKSKYYQHTNNARPQSRLLDGLTWDEVTQGAATDMPVAAASKAIIQKEMFKKQL
ncbi:hypothetical protein FGIG_02152 [Fasciola gigantica]|uniref:Uncharacterized protein n=1 Tax=Fasciola gigantica TaxID=46835 RepID=A0A504YF11_FASGI|nr:hypothetical protein FGIG_02152 [Fasciola gigantica]